jgi:iron-sulfur cluster assembly accessory protein
VLAGPDGHGGPIQPHWPNTTGPGRFEPDSSAPRPGRTARGPELGVVFAVRCSELASLIVIDRMGGEMIQLTQRAIEKVKEILESQEPKPSGLRIAVVGGGCSGFSYSMAFENTPGLLDKTYKFDGLNVFIDQASMLYLDGANVDYVETLEGSGFKFENPNVKSTCGCGSSFQA